VSTFTKDAVKANMAVITISGTIILIFKGTLKMYKKVKVNEKQR
jgi:hypothetical protein